MRQTERDSRLAKIDVTGTSKGNNDGKGDRREKQMHFAYSLSFQTKCCCCFRDCLQKHQGGVKQIYQSFRKQALVRDRLACRSPPRCVFLISTMALSCEPL